MIKEGGRKKFGEMLSKEGGKGSKEVREGRTERNGKGRYFVKCSEGNTPTRLLTRGGIDDICMSYYKLFTSI